ncbi:PPOX class probable FMN-dependent enzyme, alr4036 family [Rubidibacter lacunae KORDI 51-2]|uniref:PPOX class probable FMN-dependent enzyme, alr4036 family n=2 Tax=Rubidibacter TaxID=582491 RepID=U5DEE5_9CHRO|nr:PPOX class probable FMN-dependent enzyme, alr4036 family [Rubidibacter lacunae KORDI 51-2]
MALAPWRSPIARALHRNRSDAHARFFQLATVMPDGRPANRTVVFRGFFPNTDTLEVVTDARSEKVAQIDRQPWGEVCWYFTKTREQFRIAGRLKFVSADATDADLQRERQERWYDLSDSARLQFIWPQPKASRDSDRNAFFVKAPAANTKPASTFNLLLVEPVAVDWLELRGDPQNRTLFLQTDDGKWSVRSVNP